MWMTANELLNKTLYDRGEEWNRWKSLWAMIPALNMIKKSKDWRHPSGRFQGLPSVDRSIRYGSGFPTGCWLDGYTLKKLVDDRQSAKYCHLRWALESTKSSTYASCWFHVKMSLWAPSEYFSHVHPQNTHSSSSLNFHPHWIHLTQLCYARYTPFSSLTVWQYTLIFTPLIIAKVHFYGRDVNLGKSSILSGEEAYKEENLAPQRRWHIIPLLILDGNEISTVLSRRLQRRVVL